MAPSGEPHPSPKPQPIGNFLFLFLFSLSTICALFILWRRADSLRSVVAHQLKSWTGNEGRVRLSEDDGPSSHSFVVDDDEDDAENVDDSEPLATRAERLRNLNSSSPLPAVPPPTPPKDMNSDLHAGNAK